MLKALEINKYYKIVEKSNVYTDTKNNKKYFESDLREKLESDVLIDLNSLHCNMEFLLKNSSVFSDYDDNDEFDKLANKKYDEIIDFLEKTKKDIVDKYDTIINKYKNISVAHKELDEWVSSLEKSLEIQDVICFRVDEINILLKNKADNEEWEENLTSDEPYRENGILNTNIIDSTEYSFSFLEVYENKIKNIEFNNAFDFIELTKDEIIAFNDSLQRENEYFMSIE